MFDAALPSVRSFRGGHAVRNMAGKRDVFALAFRRDGKVCVAAQNRLYFDEIDAALHQFVYIFLRVSRIRDYQRRLERRRIAVQIWPSKENLWADALAFANLFAQRLQRFQVPAHITDGGNSVGNEERHDEV